MSWIQQSSPRGLMSARRVKNNGLSARLKSCPDAKPCENEAFGSLLKATLPTSRIFQTSPMGDAL